MSNPTVLRLALLFVNTALFVTTESAAVRVICGVAMILGLLALALAAESDKRRPR